MLTGGSFRTITVEYSLQHIRASHPDDLGRGWLWTAFVSRPLSDLLAWLFLRLGFSPNFVTLCSQPIGLAGCALLAIGGPTWLLAGALLTNVYYLFDCADGSMARTSGARSYRGAFLDDALGSACFALRFVCIGLGLWRMQGDWGLRLIGRLVPVWGPEQIGLALFVTASVVAVSYVWQWLTMLQFHIVSLDKRRAEGPQRQHRAGQPGVDRRAKGKIRKRAALAFVDFVLFDSVFPLLLVCALLNCMSLYIVFYAGALAASLPIRIASCARRL